MFDVLISIKRVIVQNLNNDSCTDNSVCTVGKMTEQKQKDLQIVPLKNSSSEHI